MGQGTHRTWSKLSLAVLGVLWGAGIGTRASHMLGVSFPAEQSPSPLLPVWGSLYSVLGSLDLAPCASWMFTLLGPAGPHPEHLLSRWNPCSSSFPGLCRNPLSTSAHSLLSTQSMDSGLAGPVLLPRLPDSSIWNLLPATRPHPMH